jgi:hypothetical protein
MFTTFRARLFRSNRANVSPAFDVARTQAAAFGENARRCRPDVVLEPSIVLKPLAWFAPSTSGDTTT